MTRFLAIVTGAVLYGILASTATAQIPDHLKCYKVKDSALKAVYTADLGGLQAEPQCSIKVPGNLLCVEATKSNVSPTPPGGADNSGAAGRFMCYKLKCPKATQAQLQWHDQFGNRLVQPGVAKILCAPEITAATTTTTLPGNICTNGMQ